MCFSSRYRGLVLLLAHPAVAANIACTRGEVGSARVATALGSLAGLSSMNHVALRGQPVQS